MTRWSTSIRWSAAPVRSGSRGTIEVGAGQEGHGDLGQRGIEADRGEQQGAGIGLHGQAFDLGEGQVGDAGMGDDHALGGAGGAGGIDDIGRVPRPQGAGAVRIRRVVPGGPGDCRSNGVAVEQDERPAPAGSRPCNAAVVSTGTAPASASIWASRPGG